MLAILYNYWKKSRAFLHRAIHVLEQHGLVLNYPQALANLCIIYLGDF